MPYISRGYRESMRPHSELPAANVGDLTFQLTDLLVRYIKHKGLQFQSIAECLGALTATQLEFYVRVVRPYEDQKIDDNGDVYPATMINPKRS